MVTSCYNQSLLKCIELANELVRIEIIVSTKKEEDWEEKHEVSN